MLGCENAVEKLSSEMKEKTTDAVEILKKAVNTECTSGSSPYMGITHEVPDYFIENDRFCKAWKENKCSRGIHAFDEVLSGDEHYLVCDVCNLVVNIKNIDTSWVEDDE